MPVITQHTYSCDDLHRCRTLWKIVWSCAVTIFSCTWIALHPNIPSPDNSSLKIAFCCVKLMVIALIALELVVEWGMQQWLVSWRLVKKYGSVFLFSLLPLQLSSDPITCLDHRWTQSDAFFAIMGGFMLCEDDKTIGLLQPEELESLADSDKINFPIITQKEIWDRRKGVGLTKGLVVAQTSWLVLQCVMCRIKHLSITELEAVTLPFAILNFLMYWLWWNKPLNVQCPVCVLALLSLRSLSPGAYQTVNWINYLPHV